MPLPDGPREPRRFSRRALLERSAIAAGALAVLPALAGSARAATRAPAPAGTSSAAANGPRTADLRGFIWTKMREARLPSLAAAVVQDDAVKWARGYGMADREAGVPANPDTVYMLASVSKTIVGAAAMQLWEQGSLDLDADVNGYLPFPVANPNQPGVPITTRQLLTHTSTIKDRWTVWGTLNNPTPPGYCHGDSLISLHDFLEGYLVPGGAYYIAAQNFYDQIPGEDYHYSNIGADLAAYVVEAISGTDFNQFCHENIFTPLGMTQTGYRLADITTPNLAMPYGWDRDTESFEPFFQYGYADYPSGALRTSATMLSRWMRCFMNYGTLEGTRILKRSTVMEMRRPQIPGNWWQGLIFYYRGNHGNPLIGHSGSDYGVSTSMFFEADAARPKGVIMLGNRYVVDWRGWYAEQDIESRLFEM